MEEKIIERFKVTKDGIFITNTEFIVEKEDQEEFYIHQPNMIEFRFQNEDSTYLIEIEHRDHDHDHNNKNKRAPKEIEMVIKHDKNGIIVSQIKSNGQEENLIYITFEKIKATKPWWHDREKPVIKLPINVSLTFDFLEVQPIEIK
ncbi:MAG: hypothetical protein JHC31_05240 [Sulfurihydrogenibium sp.]|jgi:hypothetical protein|nr:hypothetical protein [Sulfurihydrogenibium sp.]